jgi:branched-chain amino acid transport system ATP-binding protein
MASALEFRRVSAGYGETAILEGINFAIQSGESVSLIGRNGVGKTTLLRTAMGLTRLHGGEVLLGASRLSGMPAFARARLGLGFVPQEREVFPFLTVRENLEIAARPGTWTQRRVFELFPNLADCLDNMGSELSDGEQQMLSIGRALLTNPSVLLMDEPTEGLAPGIVKMLMAALLHLRGGLSIILVEQNSRVALAFSERIIVMRKGGIVYDGASAALRSNPTLLSQLVGVSYG